MLKRVIIGGLIALTLLGAGIAIGASTNDGWGPHHDAVVVTGTGTGAADGGQTIVVNEGHGPYGFFFLPFGLLFILLVILLIASAFRRRGARGGACGPRGPRERGGPPWLEEWHRRAHESPPSSDPGGAAPA